jgi:hypothetical protein
MLRAEAGWGCVQLRAGEMFAPRSLPRSFSGMGAPWLKAGAGQGAVLWRLLVGASIAGAVRYLGLIMRPRGIPLPGAAAIGLGVGSPCWSNSLLADKI